MDKSIVPLSDTVTINNGINQSLGLLLNANQAQYNIKSGTDWHLLFIRAVKSAAEGGWAFTLESLPTTEVAAIYTYGEGSYDPPRLIDARGYPVAKVKDFDAYSIPTIEYKDLIDPPPPPTPIGPTSVGNPTSYRNRQSLTNIIEVGTHIYPIAYHRISSDVPPVGQVIQVASSDWNFWPLPNIPIWSQQPEIISGHISDLLNGGTTPPTPSPTILGD